MFLSWLELRLRVIETGFKGIAEILGSSSLQTANLVGSGFHYLREKSLFCKFIDCYISIAIKLHSLYLEVICVFEERNIPTNFCCRNES